MSVSMETYSHPLTLSVYLWYTASVSCVWCFRACARQVEDNLTVILLSEIVWDQFRPNTGCFEPLLLHFPDYSKGRTVDTCCLCASAAVTEYIMMAHAWRMRREMCTCDFVLALDAAAVHEGIFVLEVCHVSGDELVLEKH